MHILIIDDDPLIRENLADMLTLNGYQVAAASDGAEGFARAKNSTPSVIITDLIMPGMDGYAFLEACRTEPRLQTVPIIVTSASDSRADIRRAMELGAADYISKPFAESEVIRSLAARLEKKEIVDELDAFAHTAAHDLKHPLTTLSVRLELAGMAIRENNGDAALLHLDAVGHSVDQLGNIIEELLLLSGVRRQVVYSAPLDMPEVLAEAQARMAHHIKSSRAQITIPCAWPKAVGYGPWVAHVWVNYLSNACKYAGPDARITLGGELNSDETRARFWVQDQGPGLTDEQQTVMFTPFTTLNNVRARGHGLGLSIVRRIVEKLGGAVGVVSKPGAGARFWFELPTTVKPPVRAPYVPACVF